MINGAVGLARDGGRHVWGQLPHAAATSTVPEHQVPLQTTATTQPTGCTGSDRA